MRTRFRGYAADCTISGYVDLPAARLSDSLERTDLLLVHDARLRSLEGAREIAAGDVTLHRSELLAVQADGPAGDRQKRVRTVRYPLRVQTGPYVILGNLHALPGMPPLRALLTRRTMVPLTSCRVVFRRDGRPVVHRAALVIVNGPLIKAVALTTAGQLESELAAPAGGHRAPSGEAPARAN
jgi:hypothetical protein